MFAEMNIKSDYTFRLILLRYFTTVLNFPFFISFLLGVSEDDDDDLFLWKTERILERSRSRLSVCPSTFCELLYLGVMNADLTLFFSLFLSLLHSCFMSTFCWLIFCPLCRPVCFYCTNSLFVFSALQWSSCPSFLVPPLVNFICVFLFNFFAAAFLLYFTQNLTVNSCYLFPQTPI